MEKEESYTLRTCFKRYGNIEYRLLNFEINVFRKTLAFVDYFNFKLLLLLILISVSMQLKKLQNKIIKK